MLTSMFCPVDSKHAMRGSIFLGIDIKLKLPVVLLKVNINSALEPIIAKKIGCDSADIFLVDKNDFEPFMVSNPVISENEV